MVGVVFLFLHMPFVPVSLDTKWKWIVMFSCFVAAIQSFAEIGFNFSSPSHVIGKKNMTPEGYTKLLEVICQKITFASNRISLY